MHNALFGYQRTGAEFLAARRVGFLFDEMGVGKTPTAIAAADLTGAVSVLVICPAIARVNWQREFEQWQTRHRTVFVVKAGADLHKGAALICDVLVVSYSLLASKRAREVLAGRHYDVLILDEAHALKTPSATRTKAVYGARLAGGIAAKAKRVWLLTGTPTPNNNSELYTHLRGLLPNEIHETPRQEDFIRRYCSVLEGDYGVKVTGNRNTPALASIIRPHTIRRRLADVQSQLPPLRWGHVVVEPDKVPVRDDTTAEEVTTLAAATAKLKKAQTDDEVLAIAEAEAMHLASLRRWTGAAKAPAIAELIRDELESGLDRVVVFAIHRAVMATIQSEIGSAAAIINGDTPLATRQKLIDEFQDGTGSLRVLIVQLSIGATALTLTAAANVMFAETSWTPADMAQAAKRCHRIGQSRPVLARTIGLKGSIDEIVSAVLMRKAQEINSFELAVTVANT